MSKLFVGNSHCSPSLISDEFNLFLLTNFTWRRFKVTFHINCWLNVGRPPLHSAQSSVEINKSKSVGKSFPSIWIIIGFEIKMEEKVKMPSSPSTVSEGSTFAQNDAVNPPQVSFKNIRADTTCRELNFWTQSQQIAQISLISYHM